MLEFGEWVLKTNKPYANCDGFFETQWFSKSRNLFLPYKLEKDVRYSTSTRIQWQLREMARQGENLYHEKPLQRCDTRRNPTKEGMWACNATAYKRLTIKVQFSRAN